MKTQDPPRAQPSATLVTRGAETGGGGARPPMCPRLRLRTRARERAGLPGHPAASARCLLPAGLPPWPQSLPTASPPRGGRSTVPGRWRAGCDPGTPAPRASHRGLSNAAPRAPLACWSLSPEVCKVRRRPGVRPPAQGAGLRGHHRKDPAPSPQPRQPCRTRWLAWPRGATFARWGGGAGGGPATHTPVTAQRCSSDWTQRAGQIGASGGFCYKISCETVSHF